LASFGGLESAEARSAKAEAIQGRLALSAGLLRHSPPKTGVNALMARNDGARAIRRCWPNVEKIWMVASI
jgi:hypothetical protein